MKRHLEDELIRNEIIQRIDVSKELELSNDIFENDGVYNIIINVNTKRKEIIINENTNMKENIKKYKYIDKRLKSLVDTINEGFMYKNIQSFILKIDDNNIFANIHQWKNQLFNEISYVEILEKEKRIDNELIKLLESNLILIKQKYY